MLLIARLKARYALIVDVGLIVISPLNIFIYHEWYRQRKQYKLINSKQHTHTHTHNKRYVQLQATKMAESIFELLYLVINF